MSASEIKIPQRLSVQEIRKPATRSRSLSSAQSVPTATSRNRISKSKSSLCSSERLSIRMRYAIEEKILELEKAARKKGPPTSTASTSTTLSRKLSPSRGSHESLQQCRKARNQISTSKRPPRERESEVTSPENLKVLKQNWKTRNQVSLSKRPPKEQESTAKLFLKEQESISKRQESISLFLKKHESSSKRLLKEQESSSNRPLKEHESISNRLLKEQESSSKLFLKKHESSSKRLVKEQESSSNRPLKEHESSSKRLLKEQESSSNRPLKKHESSSKRLLKEQESSSNRPLKKHESISKRLLKEQESISKRPLKERDSNESIQNNWKTRRKEVSLSEFVSGEAPGHDVFETPNLKKLKWKQVRDRLFEDRLSKNACLNLIQSAKNLFAAEPTLLRIDNQCVVVGDLHGQLFDMLKILAIHGDADNKNYLFLGDYVNRGKRGMEVVLIICALKIAHPNFVFALRGNHECRLMATNLNFRDEVLAKYDISVFQAVMELFDSLPVAAVVGEKFFAVHGGLCPSLRDLSSFDRVDRFHEPNDDCMLTDLMWADPARTENSDEEHNFRRNDYRQCSYFFSTKAAANFLVQTQLVSVIRAHEPHMSGYRLYPITQTGFPSIITVFSAPDYCKSGNFGAVLKLGTNNIHFHQYARNKAISLSPFSPRLQVKDGNGSAPKKHVQFKKPVSFYIPRVPEKVSEKNDNNSEATSCWYIKIHREVGIDSERELTFTSLFRQPDCPTTFLATRPPLTEAVPKIWSLGYSNSSK